MSDYVIDGGILTDIADAIREKTGESGVIIPEDMPDAIDNISNTLNIVHIWTKSTGGSDAALYAQRVVYDPQSKIITAIGEPMDIPFQSFYYGEITELDVFDLIKVKYSSPNWQLYAIGDVRFLRDMSIISNSNQIIYWHYSDTFNLYFQ